MAAEAISVTIRIPAELKRTLERLRQPHQARVMTRAMRRIGLEVLAEARRIVPVRSGKTRDSYRVIDTSGAPERVAVGSDYFVARFLEHGVTIRPRKRFMRFQIEPGVWVTLKGAYSLPARRILQRAADLVSGARAERILAEEVDREIAR